MGAAEGFKLGSDLSDPWWSMRAGQAGRESPESTGIEAASEEVDSAGRVGEAKRVSHTMIVSSKEAGDSISFVWPQYAQGQSQCPAHRNAH